MTLAALCGLLLTAAPVAHRRVVTADGVPVALYRYGEPGFPAVLLIPELGFGRALFDLEGEGLARHLAAHGRTVYVAELRGQGAAHHPGQLHRLAELVSYDLPAVASAIGQPFDLVAHGFAGTLALAASTRELEGRVRRVVAVATPALPEVPSPIAAAVLEAGGDFRALTLDATGSRALELLFTLGGRFRPGRLEALRAHGFGALGRPLSRELLGWMRSGDLRLDDGSTVVARLTAYDRPTLLFDGLLDGFAAPELCTPLKALSKAKVKLRTFSKFELATEDYSHLSLLQGFGAKGEVWEPARRFLDGAGP